MPPSAETFSSVADPFDASVGQAFFGGRCASTLGGMLLLLLLLTSATRWFMPGRLSDMEKIVQQPVMPETATFSSQNSEVTAPDPGDAP